MKANDRPFMQQLTHFIMRLFFRGLYFPQTTRRDWVKLIARNTPTMANLAVAGARERWGYHVPHRQHPYTFQDLDRA
jgi:hypothetical protein